MSGGVKLELGRAMAGSDEPNELLEICAKIVAAHLEAHPVESIEIPQLIGQVYRSIVDVQAASASGVASEPVTPINKSVTADHIVCLEDGVKLKTLKRHLRTAHNLTFAEYRERWHLPIDYPQVAPNYAKRRSVIAKEIGLRSKPSRRRKPAK
jgi:predicted transcriptional regulator